MVGKGTMEGPDQAVIIVVKASSASERRRGTIVSDPRSLPGFERGAGVDRSRDEIPFLAGHDCLFHEGT
ncbi:MAG: hypothetical protein ACUVWA_13005 [Candidatus Oleimicrobiaceae bacterium]